MSSRSETGAVVAVQQSVTTRSGPLPTAAEFEHYEQALPGAAERILSMAEREADYRHRVAERKLDGSIKLENKGQNFAFIAILFAISSTIVCVALGQPAASIAPAIIALTGLASVFLKNKK